MTKPTYKVVITHYGEVFRTEANMNPADVFSLLFDFIDEAGTQIIEEAQGGWEGVAGELQEVVESQKFYQSERDRGYMPPEGTCDLPNGVTLDVCQEENTEGLAHLEVDETVVAVVSRTDLTK